MGISECNCGDVEWMPEVLGVQINKDNSAYICEIDRKKGFARILNISLDRGDPIGHDRVPISESMDDSSALTQIIKIYERPY